MKWLVALRPVPDPALPLRWLPEETGLDWSDHPLLLNPMDEHALEAALHLRETHPPGEVIAVLVGPEAWEDTLRTALAMGADRAVRVEAPADLDPLPVAKALRAVAQRENPDAIFLGRQAADRDQSQTGPMLAGLLGWGQATFVSALKLTESTLHATCAGEGGEQELHLPLPAVVTADPRLNTPRYASLPNILKARRKPLERIPPEEMALDLSPRMTTVGWRPLPPRPPGQQVKSVEELAQRLLAMGLVPRRSQPP